MKSYRFFALGRVVQFLCFGAVVALLSACGPSGQSARIIEGLRSKDVVVRIKAIEAAESQADKPVKNELLRLFENDGELPIVRGCSGMVLGRLHEPRIVPAAIKRLPDAILSIGKSSTRTNNLDAYLLGKALQAYGPDSLTPLAALLRDPHKEVVIWTIMHHGFYRHSDRASEVLAHYLDDRDVTMRRAASFGLSLFAHKRAEDLVIRHLADPDADVRYNLAWAMSNYGSGLALKPLEAQLAREKDQRVRSELTRAIAVMKSRPVAPSPAPVAAQPVAQQAKGK